jgi:hypothetical protein
VVESSRCSAYGSGASGSFFSSSVFSSPLPLPFPLPLPLPFEGHVPGVWVIGAVIGVVIGCDGAVMGSVIGGCAVANPPRA